MVPTPNTFAFDLIVRDAEIHCEHWSYALREEHPYDCNVWKVRQIFPMTDHFKVLHAWLARLEVNLIFKTFKMRAVMAGYTIIYSGPEARCEVTWQSVGPMVAL